jgi:hypothetical protein
MKQKVISVFPKSQTHLNLETDKAIVDPWFDHCLIRLFDDMERAF